MSRFTDESRDRVRRTLAGLFDHYLDDPDTDVQAATDYVAGMTDRFAIATFKRLSLPEESRL